MERMIFILLIVIVFVVLMYYASKNYTDGEEETFMLEPEYEATCRTNFINTFLAILLNDFGDIQDKTTVSELGPNTVHVRVKLKCVTIMIDFCFAARKIRVIYCFERKQGEKEFFEFVTNHFSIKNDTCDFLKVYNFGTKMFDKTYESLVEVYNIRETSDGFSFTTAAGDRKVAYTVKDADEDDVISPDAKESTEKEENNLTNTKD